MRRHRAIVLAAALSAAGLLLTACGRGGDDAASQTPVAGDEVRVVDNEFVPPNLEVAAGETVTWVWESSAGHDVVGDGFDSGVRDGGTFTHTFEEAGSYDYECTIHRGMTGRITVTDP